MTTYVILHFETTLKKIIHSKEDRTLMLKRIGINNFKTDFSTRSITSITINVTRDLFLLMNALGTLKLVLDMDGV